MGLAACCQRCYRHVHPSADLDEHVQSHNSIDMELLLGDMLIWGFHRCETDSWTQTQCHSSNFNWMFVVTQMHWPAVVCEIVALVP